MAWKVKGKHGMESEVKARKGKARQFMGKQGMAWERKA
jgi:hypothetical protein